MINTSPFSFIVGIAVVIFGVILAKKFLLSKQEPEQSLRQDPTATTSKSTTITAKVVKPKLSAVGKLSAQTKFSPACAKPDSPQLLYDIGGHAAEVLAFSCSPNGQIICSISRDGIMRCTAVSDIGSATQQHTASTALAGVDVYSDLALTWTANSKRVVVNIGSNVVFFKVDIYSEKKLISEAKTMKTPLLHIHKIQLLDVEKWMLVAVSGEAGGNENLVMMFDHAGTAVGVMNADGALDRHVEGLSGKNRTSKAKERATLVQRRILLEASPDNRYLAISGHVANPTSPSPKLGWSDIGIYEAARMPSGEPTGLTLVYILAGHESPVSAVTWTPSGQSAATVCRAHANASSESEAEALVWRVWGTTAPKIDLPVSLYATSNAVPEGASAVQVVLNQPGTVAVFVSGCDIYYCSSGNGQIKNSIKGALGNAIMCARSCFLESGDSKELRWCFVTVVKSSKRVAVWKFKA